MPTPHRIYPSRNEVAQEYTHLVKQFVEAKVDLYKSGRFEQTYTLGVFSFDEINADLWDRELAGGHMFRYITK